MNKSVKKFWVRALLFSIPLALMVSFYFYLDPFKVVRHYDTYLISGQPEYVTLNKDYVSMENYLNVVKDHTPTSFIFGNSRSMFYRVDVWKQYIHVEKNQCYHFDASNENIYGIERKLHFLHQHNAPINNVLIVLDATVLQKTENNTGHLYRKHPYLTGESWVGFEVDFLKTYFNFDFMSAYLDFKINGKIKPYMTKNSLLDDKVLNYDSSTNEISFITFDSLIKNDPDDYYTAKRIAVFKKRNPVEQISPAVIGQEQQVLLKSIKNYFDSCHTNFRIVISPIYDQVKLNPADYKYLTDLFGSCHVYDFSGQNAITNDYHNYYEISHYRPPIANQIMQKIYTDTSCAGQQ